MKLRNKILLYFSTTLVTLMVIAFCAIYWLFAANREEEFQQNQYQKIKTTVSLIKKFKEESAELASLLDAQSIHDFYDEKLIVYNSQKVQIFSSLDNLQISKRNKILNALSPATKWIETKEDNYDLIGVYVQDQEKSYYAISKAFDAFGYKKLQYLKNLLFGISIGFTAIIILISIYFSNVIAKPINLLAKKLNLYNLDETLPQQINIPTSTYELQYLNYRFNELLNRTQEAFTFQKHITNHISHQLKTPIAVLVSEMEKLQNLQSIASIQEGIKIQIFKAKSLGNIINALLEIAKIESGKTITEEVIRIDEVLFDLLEEANRQHAYFKFNLALEPNTLEAEQLCIRGNKTLLQQAFANAIANCIAYSSEPQATILINATEQSQISILFSNKGKTITTEEQQLMFHHFFRGENSIGKSGFGLGLVLIQKIIQLHKGFVSYSNSKDNVNHFNISIPSL